MFLFGPKASCPRCGKKVGKPKDPNQYLCPHCRHPGPWASPEQTHAWEGARDARLRYSELLKQLVSGGSTTALAPMLKETAPRTWYTQAELQQIALREFDSFARTALDDKVLTEDEEHRLGELVVALGLSWHDIFATQPDLADGIVIGRANDGRLPVVDGPDVLLKDTEVLHAQYPASLMKEVTIRQWRAGSRGISLPIGKTRARVRFGATRGQSVVVGTEMQVADEGLLSVTSTRAIFTGARKTIEMQYKKLANLSVFTDGVQFHVTNRQSAPLFTVRNGEVIAAIVNAAVRRAD